MARRHSSPAYRRHHAVPNPCAGHPVIMLVRFSPLIGHAVVLRGMEFVATPFGVQAFLFINDPARRLAPRIEFGQLIRVWEKAIRVF